MTLVKSAQQLLDLACTEEDVEEENDEDEEREVVVVDMEGMEGVMTMDVRKLLLYLRQLVVARRDEGAIQSEDHPVGTPDDVVKVDVDRRGAAAVLVLLQLELVYEGTIIPPITLLFSSVIL